MNAGRTPTLTRVLFIVIMAGVVSFAAAADWRQVTDVPGWSQRTGHSLVVLDNKIWLLGGVCVTSDFTFYTDVWYSADGDNWTLATTNAAWGPRGAQAAVAFDDKLWFIGGESIHEGGSCKDVWYSPDGVTWTLATNTAP